MWGSFRISEGNITRRKKKQRKKKTQNICVTITPNGEVAQTLAPTTGKQGLNREAPAALLRVSALRTIYGS